MIEFALSIPFFLLVLFAIIYFGRYYFITQILLSAAQEGAKVACRTPNLGTDANRDAIRGFSTTGSAINTNSIIYAALASARLLSQGNTGDMPAGSRVEILPWDSDGTASDTIPAGTVEVRIDYPFEVAGNPFTTSIATNPNAFAIAMTTDGSRPPFTLPNFTITQRAVAAQEIYQSN